MRFVALCLVAVMTAGVVVNAATPDETARKRAASEKVLAETPDGQQFWESLGDGAIRHKSSGLVCPADALPDIPLVKLSIVQQPVPEAAAQCSYRSADDIRHVDLFATKTGPGQTTDTVFQLLHETTLGSGVRSITPLKNLLIPSARGEAFATATNDGKPAVTILYVVLVKNWIIWTTATIPDEKQNAASAEMRGMVFSAPFVIGVMGAVRTANGIPEPRAGD